MRLRKMLARIKQGDRTFYTGDGFLSEVNVSIGENDRSSNCSYTLVDPRLKVGAAMFEQSFEAGGIAVPDDLLEAPPEVASATGAGQSQVFESLADLPGDGQLIVNECGRQGLVHIPSIAYVMGTVQHETGTYKPVDEIGGPRKHYAPYYGRGYVQLTWRENYAKYSKLLGKDFVGNPDLVKEPATSAYILVHGFINGIFTGRKLGDYVNESKKDFMNARKCINGTDRAALIAGYARDWEKKLEGLKVKSASTTTDEKAIAPPAPSPSPTGAPDLADKADTAPAEVSQKGTETIVGIGEDFLNLTDFHFIHTATDVSVRPSTTTLKGQTIRWLLARRKANTTYKDVTLREVAERVCNAHGLVLDMEGDGPKYAHLDQSGLSDFGLILRECKAIGFSVSETGNQLQIRPLRPQFTGFVIEPNMVIGGSLKFSDAASGDMPANRNVAAGGAEPKAEMDAMTGAIVQVRPEDSRGTTGGAEAGRVTGDAQPKIYGSIAVSDAAAGLPTQATGAIALAGGQEVQAEQLKTELQRVQGYKSNVTLKMTDATLGLLPGNIIAISPNCAGGIFAREWRISNIEHSIGESGSTTALSFYTPQEAIPKKQEAIAQSGAGGAGETLDSEASAQGFIFPYPDGKTYVGEGLGPRGGGRMHRGTDLAGSQGEATFCMKAGRCIDTVTNCRVGNQSCGGGFGNRAYIQSEGIIHIYAHLASVNVKVGDQVAQGQKIGGMGSTGGSTGPHLHLELRRGASRLALSDVGIDITKHAIGRKRAGFRY